MAMTICVRPKAYVGTTYKRALTRKIPVRDRCVPLRLTLPEAIGESSHYDRVTTTKETGNAQTARLRFRPSRADRQDESAEGNQTSSAWRTDDGDRCRRARHGDAGGRIA